MTIVMDRGSGVAIWRQIADLLRQVSAQARQTGVPRPDETLAALATAAAGR